MMTPLLAYVVDNECGTRQQCCSSNSDAVHQPNYTGASDVRDRPAVTAVQPSRPTASQQRRPMLAPRRQRECPKTRKLRCSPLVSQFQEYGCGARQVAALL